MLSIITYFAIKLLFYYDYIYGNMTPVKKSSRGIRVKDILIVGAFTYPRGAVEIWQK